MKLRLIDEKWKSYKMIQYTGLLAMVRMIYTWDNGHMWVGSGASVKLEKVITIKTEILF